MNGVSSWKPGEKTNSGKSSDRAWALYRTTTAQGKLVRCVYGEVFDVAVDIRPGSTTFGQWYGAKLSGTNHLQIWVPPGFAHGFQVLSDSADVVYKCTDYYDPGGEGGLIWNDPNVAIDWPFRNADLSHKDSIYPQLNDLY
jgi:dTDP-4-dehydrorhamnose 3,5-epimerase